MPKYIYNHVKDKVNSRDLIFSSEHFQAGSAVLPKVFDLRTTDFVPAILDQGKLGTCAANEISNALRYCLDKELALKFQPSRLYLYYFGRLLDGSPTDQDTGISVRSGMQVVKNYGVCSETMLKYDITKYTEKPHTNACAAAKQHMPNYKYLSVPQNLNSIKQALNAGYPVVLGVQVYDSFEADSTVHSGNIPMPNLTTESNLGGHCVSLYGWNDDTQTFLMMNSWGTSVGVNGWFQIPYAYITDSNLTSDLWTVKFFK
jgi:C1A family cysteine protease